MKTNKNGFYGYDLVEMWCGRREKAYINIYCPSLLDKSESIPVLSDKVISVADPFEIEKTTRHSLKLEVRLSYSRGVKSLF